MNRSVLGPASMTRPSSLVVYELAFSPSQRSDTGTRGMPTCSAARARRGGRRRGRGVRAVVPQLLHVPRHAGDLPGGPVRTPGASGRRAWPGAAGGAGRRVPAARVRAAGVVGAGLERAGDRLLQVARRGAVGRLDDVPADRRRAHRSGSSDRPASGRRWESHRWNAPAALSHRAVVAENCSRLTPPSMRVVASLTMITVPSSSVAV